MKESTRNYIVWIFAALIIIGIVVFSANPKSSNSQAIDFNNQLDNKTGWIFVRVGDYSELESYLNNMPAKQAIQSKVIYNNESKMFYVVYLSGATN